MLLVEYMRYRIDFMSVMESVASPSGVLEERDIYCCSRQRPAASDLK